MFKTYFRRSLAVMFGLPAAVLTLTACGDEAAPSTSEVHAAGTASDPHHAGPWFQELRQAVLENDVEATRAALDRGADPNAKDRDKPILLIASLRGSKELLQLLIDRGASIAAASELGVTPLMGAALAGNLPAAELLLAQGADSEVTNQAGTTILMVAISSGHAQIAERLIAHGADVARATLLNASTALHLAAGKDMEQVVVQLLKRGANPNAKDRVGNLPLNYARGPAVRSILERAVGESGPQAAAPAEDRDASIVATKNAIQEVWAEFQKAVAAQDGQSVAQLANTPSIEALAVALRLAREASREELQREAQTWRKLVGLFLRSQCSAEQLGTMNGRDVFARLIESGLLDLSAFADLSLQDTEVMGQAAKVVVAPAADGLALNFGLSLEPGGWRFDLLPSFAAEEARFRKRIAEIEGSAEDPLLAVLSQVLGKPCNPELWNPPPR